MPKHTHRVIIVSNGNLDKQILKEIDRGDYVIGVDRAAFWLIAHGVAPDVAVGDFDSTTKIELHQIQVVCMMCACFRRKKISQTQNWRYR